MSELGRVLVADDEEVFRQAIVDLLRKAGYGCDGVPDAAEALAHLRQHDVDVLIADIRMPGNSELEMVRQLPEIAQGLQVILVTGYPSMDTAVDSVQLPVAAYMAKPVDFDELLGHVRASVQTSRIRRAVARTHQRLREWGDELDRIEQAMAVEHPGASAVPVTTFVSVTLRSIAGALVDLGHLTEAMSLREGQADACRLRDCPRLAALTDAMSDTIAVIEKTKKTFKSKELGNLRQRLEDVFEGTLQK